MGPGQDLRSWSWDQDQLTGEIREPESLCLKTLRALANKLGL